MRLKAGTKIKLQKDISQNYFQFFYCRSFAGVLQVVYRLFADYLQTESYIYINTLLVSGPCKWRRHQYDAGGNKWRCLTYFPREGGWCQKEGIRCYSSHQWMKYRGKRQGHTPYIINRMWLSASSDENKGFFRL